jgi:hypothetical protein
MTGLGYSGPGFETHSRLFVIGARREAAFAAGALRAAASAAAGSLLGKLMASGALSSFMHICSSTINAKGKDYRAARQSVVSRCPAMQAAMDDAKAHHQHVLCYISTCFYGQKDKKERATLQTGLLLQLLASATKYMQQGCCVLLHQIVASYRCPRNICRHRALPVGVNTLQTLRHNSCCRTQLQSSVHTHPD